MTDNPTSTPPEEDAKPWAADKAPSVASSPTATVPAATRDGLARGLSVLALAAALGGTGYLYQQQSSAIPLAPGVTPAELAQVRQDVGTLTEKLAQLAAAPPTPAVTAMPTPTVNTENTAHLASKAQLQTALDEMTALRAKFNNLQDGVAQAEALKQELAQMKSDLSVANTAISGMRGHVQQMTASTQQAAATEAASRARILAYMQLRSAAAAAAPFEMELSSLCTLTRAMPALTAECVKLERAAAGGVATLPMLQGRFAVMAPPAERAVAMAEAKDWKDRLKVSLDEVVRIRKIGESGETEMPKLMHDTSAALQRGNLAAALAKVQTMPPLAQQALQEWLGDAQLRLDVDAALVRIGTALGQEPVGENQTPVPKEMSQDEPVGNPLAAPDKGAPP